MSQLSAQWSNGQNADVVLGAANFTTMGGFTTSDSSMNRVRGICIDPNTGKVFVTDLDNNRVLRFNSVDVLRNGGAAEAIFGQPNGQSTSSGSGIDQFFGPNDVAVDSAGNLYVADGNNSRVLRFANASTASTGSSANASFTGLIEPTGVCIGPSGTLWVADFSANKVFRYNSAPTVVLSASPSGYLGTGSGSVAANTLGTPADVAVDTAGTLYVSCFTQNRVLQFLDAANKADSANADGGLGQGATWYSTTAAGTSAFALSGPWGLAVNGADLYVADRNNNRVLRFVDVTTNGYAFYVFGQPDFVTADVALTQNGMNDPNGVAIGNDGTLFVTDFNNQRVLRFENITSKTNGANADGVLGQPDFITTSTYRTTGNRYSIPYNIVIDNATGKVFVGDYGANRILRFSSTAAMTNGSAPEAVIGQTNFTSTNNGTAADKLSANYGMAIDASGRLWVADNVNNRVLRFDNAAACSSGASASQVLGQANYTSSTSNTTQDGMSEPVGVAIDASGNLYVAEQGNSRVIIYLNAASKSNGANADIVLGQPNFTSSSIGADQSTMQNCTGVAISSTGTLWVADPNNNRVLRFDNAASKSSGAAADGVLGQTNFVLVGSATTQSGMNYPYAVSVDNTGTLYCADASNNRVLVFLNAASKSNGANADYVLGQTDFVSGAPNTVQDGLNYPTDVTIDSNNGKLWVMDASNYRALRYTSSSPLPVELVSVSTAVKQNNVELHWKTATELSSHGFEIERKQIPLNPPLQGESREAAEGFRKIGFVEGAGNSNAPKEYSFADAKVTNGKYEYRLKLVDRDGSFKYSQSVEAEVKFVPSVFSLSQNYPNPFNPSTAITYQLPKNSHVSLKVYDILGKEVVTLVDEVKEAGSYNVQFNAQNIASGVYFYRMVAGDIVQMKEMMLIK